MEFLPAWPLRFNELMLFSLLLGAGLLGGHLAGRTTFLPRITGYIAAGFLLGPSVSGLLTTDLLGHARLFTDIALGLILYDLGRLLKLRELRTSRWLLTAGLAESMLSFLLIFVLLRLAGLHTLSASMVAAVGISSSPAVLLLVTRQLGARGIVTSSAINLVAMNNVLAFFMFLTVLPLLHLEQQASLLTIFLQPLYQLGVSLAIAYGLSRLMVWVARHLGPRENAHFALTIAVIIGAIGLAKMLNVSSLLMLLSLGILSSALDREERLLQVEFGYGGELFFLILFVVAGANIHLYELTQAGLFALLFVVARIAAKSVSTYAVMRYADFDHRRSVMLGLTLTPMAGLAIGLSQMAYDLYPQFSRDVEIIVLAAVAIFETIGPVATEFALKQSGEVQNGKSIEH